MDIKRLEYFLAVAEHGSFSRAASVIGVAQPALGRQVQRLEASCGVKLFYRHGRGVALTPDGEIFIERIRPLLRELSQVTQGLGGSERPLSGSVTIGMTPTVIALIGLPLIKRLRGVAPGIKLNFLTGYSGYVHEWLLDGRLDIAIVHDARRSQHIAVDHLATARLFLVSQPEAAERLRLDADMENGGIRVDQLARLPLALPSRAHGLRRTIEQAAGKRRVELDVVFELDALMLMKAVALEGLAHTILAMPAVVQDVLAGTLQTRPIVDPDLETRLMLAMSLNRPLTEVARAVIAELRSVLQEEVQGSAQDLQVTVS